LWWFRTEPASVRVAIDWQAGASASALRLSSISFAVVDVALASWLLDQQEPDDIVEVPSRAVSRRVALFAG
jgi:orotate phosphoribosyltransferase-like protein